MNGILSVFDIVIPSFYLIIFYFIAKSITRSRLEQEPYYRYFIPGLFIKLISSILVCLVYIYIYQGGDTLNYYNDNAAISRLMLIHPLQSIRLTFLGLDAEVWTSLSNKTGYLVYMLDPRAIMVVRLTWFLSFISFNSFIAQTFLLNFICFFSIWRLFKMFVYEVPKIETQLAFSILFIPSVVFWGSGLLKDSITFAAVSQFTASFHHLLKIRKKTLWNVVTLFLSSFLLISIKPYILFALLPGSLLWFIGYKSLSINNPLLRRMVLPFFLLIALLSAFLLLLFLDSSLGEFSVNKVIDKAITTQQDLKQDYYQGSSFDLGTIDASWTGMFQKMPKAIIAALFRPYIWESNNVGMLVSGLENLVLLIVSVYLLLRLRIIHFFRLLLKSHLLFFSVFFSLFFSFSIGLSTSNFGSLVRYKIPAIPFYVASLFIIYNSYKEEQEARNRDSKEAVKDDQPGF